MQDKCSEHDRCMDAIKTDIHDGFDELKDMLRDGSIVHVEMKHRLDRHESEIRTLQDHSKRINWYQEIFRLAINLVEKIIIVITGLAAWALMNGYGVKEP